MKIISLDTNAYSALTNGDPQIKEVIEFAEKVYVPVIVVAELMYGFKNGSKEPYNMGLLAKFLQLPGVQIFHTTDRTPEIYAELSLHLKKNGTPIPSNDIWIAACAIEAGSILITYDKHFWVVDDVDVWEELS